MVSNSVPYLGTSDRMRKPSSGGTEWEHGTNHLPGDVLLLIEPADIVVGDIVVFQTKGSDERGGIPIIHRCLEVHQTPDGPRYLTKGDHNKLDDAKGGIYGYRQQYLTQEELMGKAVMFFPQNGISVNLV
eukprot:TRINITY_DN6126_c0_g1_i1.p1 TRINITY_DN6126_c0_g1~~TRINITY_DN6126_c0_g1_i1.p1  ORF type:complete len:130 (-),score=9.84 TRINITY_DN6126_c0_g1_i1:25-414(-)